MLPGLAGSVHGFNLTKLLDQIRTSRGKGAAKRKGSPRRYASCRSNPHFRLPIHWFFVAALSGPSHQLFYSMPADHIDARRAAFFMARSILRAVQGGEPIMLISLHKLATTTPKIRATIRASPEPALMVAERYGNSEQTVWKWRKRDSVHDRSHTPHRLQTTLTPAQEAVAVAMRKSLLLPLEDLLSAVGEFLNPTSLARVSTAACNGTGRATCATSSRPRPRPASVCRRGVISAPSSV